MPKASLNLPPISGVVDKNVQSALQAISNWSRALNADYVSRDELKLTAQNSKSVSTTNTTIVASGSSGTVGGSAYAQGLYQMPLWVRGEVAVNLESLKRGTGVGVTKEAPLAASMLARALGTNSIGIAAYAPAAPNTTGDIYQYGGFAGTFYGDTGILVDTTRSTYYVDGEPHVECGDAIRSFGTVRVEKPAHVMDEYRGGLFVERNASACAGGISEHVNTAVYAKTTSGATEIQNEWTGLFIMDNKAAAGENVAVYGQGNQIGTGPTWAACFEVRGTNPYATGMLTAAELHCSALGPITEDHKSRYGALVVLSDYRWKNEHIPSGVVQGAAGVLITTDEFGENTTLKDVKWHRGIQTMGNFGTLLDFTKSTYEVGIKTQNSATPFIVNAHLQVLPPIGSLVTPAAAKAGFGVWWGAYDETYNSYPSNTAGPILYNPLFKPTGQVHLEGLNLKVSNGGRYLWQVENNVYDLCVEVLAARDIGSYEHPFEWKSDNQRDVYPLDNGLWWQNKAGAKLSIPDELGYVVQKTSRMTQEVSDALVHQLTLDSDFLIRTAGGFFFVDQLRTTGYAAGVNGSGFAVTNSDLLITAPSRLVFATPYEAPLTGYTISNLAEIFGAVDDIGGRTLNVSRPSTNITTITGDLTVTGSFRPVGLQVESASKITFSAQPPSPLTGFTISDLGQLIGAVDDIGNKTWNMSRSGSTTSVSGAFTCPSLTVNGVPIVGNGISKAEADAWYSPSAHLHSTLTGLTVNNIHINGDFSCTHPSVGGPWSVPIMLWDHQTKITALQNAGTGITQATADGLYAPRTVFYAGAYWAVTDILAAHENRITALEANKVNRGAVSGVTMDVPGVGTIAGCTIYFP